MIVAQEITVEHVNDLDGAYGTPSGGQIQIPNGLATAAELSVLVHEYSHELLNRLTDRPTIARSRATRAN
jgi:hypothetical protein